VDGLKYLLALSDAGV